jgi:hypothetical protein
MRRRIPAGALALSAMVGTVAPAAAADRPRFEREYLARYAELRDRHGVRAPGCNLVSDRYENRCAGRASRREVLGSLATLERMLHVPRPAPAPAAPSASTTASTTASSSAQVPSYTAGGGGSCGPGYRGLFQFDCATWRSVGGSGDPAAASPDEQWRRAAALQDQRGNQPWPVCGAGGASLEQIMRCESGGDPDAVG